MLDGAFNPDPTNTALEDLPTPSTSPAAKKPAPSAPAAADSATAPGWKDGSATSNAATGCADHASKATKATRSGTAGRPSPTTQTPTPPSDDTNNPENQFGRAGANPAKRKTGTEPRTDRPPPLTGPHPLRLSGVYPGEVARAPASPIAGLVWEPCRVAVCVGIFGRGWLSRLPLLCQARVAMCGDSARAWHEGWRVAGDRVGRVVGVRGCGGWAGIGRS